MKIVTMFGRSPWWILYTLLGVHGLKQNVTSAETAACLISWLLLQVMKTNSRKAAKQEENLYIPKRQENHSHQISQTVTSMRLHPTFLWGAQEASYQAINDSGSHGHPSLSLVMALLVFDHIVLPTFTYIIYRKERKSLSAQHTLSGHCNIRDHCIPWRRSINTQLPTNMANTYITSTLKNREYKNICKIFKNSYNILMLNYMNTRLLSDTCKAAT